MKLLGRLWTGKRCVANISRHACLSRMIRLSTVLCCVSLCSLSSVLVQAGTAEASPSGWSVAPSANQGTGDNYLEGQSCTSSTNCVAVGYDTNGSGVNQTLIESWDGTGWTITPSPNQGSGNNQLGGVSCTSSTNCVAVGSYDSGSGTETLIESWDGTAWTITPSPDDGNAPYDDDLVGVSCTSSTNCVAVGYWSGGIGYESLIESWDGTAWTITPSPDEGGSASYLFGVSCTSPTNCAAVGFYANTSAQPTVYQTLIESWDGTAWSVTSSPNYGPGNNQLGGVSCTSSTSCVAVGSYDSGSGIETLIESWNGQAWSGTSSPNQGSPSYLSGVSCTSSTCVAVGYFTNGSGVNQTLIESWDGAAWSVTSSPNQGSGDNQLSGVSCTSSISCVAVGYFTNGSGINQTLVETGFTPPPTITRFGPTSGPPTTVVSITGTNLSGATEVSFNGTPASDITMDTATKIWAQVPTGATTGKIRVTTPGGTVKSATNFTVTEAPPSPWSITSSPNVGTVGDVLSGVSCTSSTYCVAVGSYDGGSGTETLIESWNGTKWRVASSPNVGTEGDGLSGVSCTSSTYCVAVGSYDSGDGADTLIESWNGTKWKATSSGGASATYNVLSGVSCISSTNCIAVGSSDDQNGVPQTLTQEWDGTRWSDVSSPDYMSGMDDIPNSLNGVSCSASVGCLAVGQYYDAPGADYQTLVLFGNGKTWSIVSSPNPSGEAFLFGASCASSTNCVAVGSYAGGPGSLIESMNGSRVKRSPNPSGDFNQLNGISCVSSTCVAVGFDTASQSLVESWDGAGASIVSSPNQGSGGNSLKGVSCTNSTACVAVGSYTNASGVNQTLIETTTPA